MTGESGQTPWREFSLVLQVSDSHWSLLAHAHTHTQTLMCMHCPRISDLFFMFKSVVLKNWWVKERRCVLELSCLWFESFTSLYISKSQVRLLLFMPKSIFTCVQHIYLGMLIHKCWNSCTTLQATFSNIKRTFCYSSIRVQLPIAAQLVLFSPGCK